MDLVGGGMVGVMGLAVFFGGIALLMLLDGRNKARERQCAHAERLKALELGQTLPDAEIARASAETHRAWAAGLVALFVPLGLAGTAVGATALVFQQASQSSRLPLLCVIWGICGLVALVTVTTGLGILASNRGETTAPALDDAPLSVKTRESNPLATAFREESRVP